MIISLCSRAAEHAAAVTGALWEMRFAVTAVTAPSGPVPNAEQEQRPREARQTGACMRQQRARESQQEAVLYSLRTNVTQDPLCLCLDPAEFNLGVFKSVVRAVGLLFCL